MILKVDNDKAKKKLIIENYIILINKCDNLLHLTEMTLLDHSISFVYDKISNLANTID
jgi:hypothetical protein